MRGCSKLVSTSISVSFMKNNLRLSEAFGCALAVSMLGAFSAGCFPARAGDVSFPTIINGPSNADSQMVLKAAKAAFDSKVPRLADAGSEVRRRDKNLVLWPVEQSDIECDTTLFDKSPEGGESTFLVQKRPFEGTRYITRQKPFNWQGDNYSVALTTTNDTSSEIFKKLGAIEMNQLPKGYVSVTVDTWQRPWIFRNPSTGKMIAVDTGHPADFLEDWSVYEPTKSSKCKELCKIRFRKPSKKVADLLPQGPLSQLAVLLDSIIGKAKENEGTMQATARLRNDVERMWGNLLLRPWAMKQPDNSKAQVERHLKHWQRGARSYKAQYARLQVLYPQAQLALTRYYEQNLKKSHADAAKMAATNLDIAYRSHFSL